ncbi:2272_t:CDS:2 [Ambispora gerdemannii]|uniref:2272_t:CDS:1 n=1 Tax=Ambispora gerdemannii TaxID=144530 RepID=A0A9N9GC52_9GLOM|nr:2272_t:CDS:2 [Ambispora gerdemannii]
MILIQSYYLTRNNLSRRFFCASVVVNNKLIETKYQRTIKSLQGQFQNKQEDSLKKQPKQIRQFIRRPWRSKIDVFTFPDNSNFPNQKDREKENDKQENEQINNKAETITAKKSTPITLTQIPVHSFKKSTLHGFFLEIKQQTITAFMPKGYPYSVADNYLNFAKWQFMHNVAGSVTGVLATQSLLYGLAALNWIIKDGLGQLGGVIYAASISDRFDSEPKRHRFQSTVAMQLASVLELMTPLWPNMFLLIASVSNIGKNIAWLAGSATRAQMHKTFALRDNLGDLTGKSGSQTTAAGLLGAGIGITISAAITTLSTSAASSIAIDSISSTTLPAIYIFAAFMPFSALNLYASYQSSLYVTSSTLNVPRAEMILHEVLFHHSPFSPLKLEKYPKISVFTPREISVQEVFVRRYRSKFNIPIVIEPALHQYPCDKYDKELYSAFQQEGFKHHAEYFLLHVFDKHHIFANRLSSRFQYFSNSKIFGNEHDTLWKDPRFQLKLKNIRQQQHVALWFSQRAKPKDMIKGFAHACAFRFSLDRKIQEQLEQEPEKVFDYKDSEQVVKVVNDTYDWVDKVSEELFEGLLAEKWDIEYLFFAEREDGRLFTQPILGKQILISKTTLLLPDIFPSGLLPIKINEPKVQYCAVILISYHLSQEDDAPVPTELNEAIIKQLTEKHAVAEENFVEVVTRVQP